MWGVLVHIYMITTASSQKEKESFSSAKQRDSGKFKTIVLQE